MPVYKDEERGTWYAKFNYVTWDGKTKQKLKRGFKLQKEAKAYERSFKEKAHANPDMSFRSLVEIYLDDCKTRLKPTTYRTKKSIIDARILPYFGEMTIDAIEPSTIRKWQNNLMEDPAGYSGTYLKMVHGQLSAVMNFAVKYYKLRSNPAKIVGSIGKGKADSMQFWTRQEFEKFIKVTEDKPIAHTMFNLLFWTGIRSGELLALTLDDFDFEKNTVSINKNYARLHRKDLILEPKTPKSNREITIPEFLCELVDRYAANLYDYKSNERLFPVTNSYLQKEMTKMAKMAKVKRIRIHDIRHSHASLLIEMGFSPLLISERMGHENIETTLQTYSHLYPNKHNEVAEKLQEIAPK